MAPFFISLGIFVFCALLMLVNFFVMMKEGGIREGFGIHIILGFFAWLAGLSSIVTGIVWALQYLHSK